MTQGSRFNGKDWISVGGVLGAAILFARVTRIPLATLITVLPFLLTYLRKAESEAPKQHHHATMTRGEAALILGIDELADEAGIREAHRRLIQKNHPDSGGSDYLAAKINQARDVMLGKG